VCVCMSACIVAYIYLSFCLCVRVYVAAVTAVQRGKNIYSTLICFQRPEKGWEHQGRRRDTTRLPSPGTYIAHSGE
jgi:hypothetical protein